MRARFRALDSVPIATNFHGLQPQRRFVSSPASDVADRARHRVSGTFQCLTVAGRDRFLNTGQQGWIVSDRAFRVEYLFLFQKHLLEWKELRSLVSNHGVALV